MPFPCPFSLGPLRGPLGQTMEHRLGRVEMALGGGPHCFIGLGPQGEQRNLSTISVTTAFSSRAHCSGIFRTSYSKSILTQKKPSTRLIAAWVKDEEELVTLSCSFQLQCCKSMYRRKMAVPGLPDYRVWHCIIKLLLSGEAAHLQTFCREGCVRQEYMGTRALWVGLWNTCGLLPSMDSREESLSSQFNSPVTHISLGNLWAAYSLRGRLLPVRPAERLSEWLLEPCLP